MDQGSSPTPGKGEGTQREKTPEKLEDWFQILLQIDPVESRGDLEDAINTVDFADEEFEWLVESQDLGEEEERGTNGNE